MTDDTTTPWKRNGRRYWRYLYGYLLVVERVDVATPRLAIATRWEATLDGGHPGPRTDGLHTRMSDAKAQAEDYAQRSCAGCRRSGAMRDLAGEEYVCTECHGVGVHLG